MYVAVIMTIICAGCGTCIERIRPWSKYCSAGCRNKCELEKYRIKNPSYSLPKGTTGKLNELIVSADLLKRGYEVFMALSPHASCDMAILKGGELFRVEVKTAYKSKSGKAQFPVKLSQRGSHDILALVFYPGEVEYRGLPPGGLL